MPGDVLIADTREECQEALDKILRRYPREGYGTVSRIFQQNDGKWHMTAHWWGAD
jgi:hypothetical protein